MSGDDLRLAALARSAARLAARDTLDAVLVAIAQEIHELGDAAGVQVVLAEGDATLELMGAAGFARDPEFFGTLAACRERGADLLTFRALHSDEQIVQVDRISDMLASPEWEPMHPYLREVEWSDFVATPFHLQGGGAGVINCYMAIDASVDESTTAFFHSMAELAALAVDHHQLILREREQTRLEERTRVARDIHDSVMQRLFAMGLQSRALERLSVGLGADGTEIAAIARDFHETSHSVRRELRTIIDSSRHIAIGDTGVVDALETFAARWRRDGLRIDVTVDARVDRHVRELREDVYFVLTESVFNALRHANPTLISVQLHDSDGIECAVADNGVGFDTRATRGGFGLLSMEQRIGRWGGSLRIDSGAHGTTVSARLGPFVDGRDR